MGASKIRIKIGQIEVEYEGPEQFLKKELPDLLEALTELHNKSGNLNIAGNVAGDDNAGAGVSDNGIIGTIATIAGKLGSKSANDLIIAAAAQLTFVGKKSEFSRKDLHDSIKSATGYYKESMSKNFTNYLSGRVKAGELMEARAGHYALSAQKKQELAKALS